MFRRLIEGLIVVAVLFALVGAGVAGLQGSASYVYGQPSFVTSTPMVAPDALNSPTDAIFDRNGNLYVADFGNYRVVRFDSRNGYLGDTTADLVFGQASMYTNYSGIGDTQMGRPLGLAIDDSGNLYVSDMTYNRIVRFNADSDGIVRDTTVDFQIGVSSFSGTSDTMLGWPNGLVIDDSGNLYVADYESSRILRFDASGTGIVNDSTADFIIGQKSFFNSYTGVGDTQLNKPYDIAFDQSRALIVSDQWNSRVLRFEADTSASGIITDTAADQVFGQPTFAAKTPSVGIQGLDDPAGVDVDPSGNLWIADHDNNRVLGFSVGSGGAVTDTTADYVLGQHDDFDTNVANAVGSGSSALSASGLQQPYGVSFHQGNGKLAIADYGNARILIYDPASQGVKGDDNNCFVATSAYGKEANELSALHQFRDETLLSSRIGRSITSAYYSVGPHVAPHVTRDGVTGRITRTALLPAVGFARLANTLGLLGTLILSLGITGAIMAFRRVRS